MFTKFAVFCLLIVSVLGSPYQSFFSSPLLSAPAPASALRPNSQIHRPISIQKPIDFTVSLPTIPKATPSQYASQFSAPAPAMSIQTPVSNPNIASSQYQYSAPAPAMSIQTPVSNPNIASSQYQYSAPAPVPAPLQTPTPEPVQAPYQYQTNQVLTSEKPAAQVDYEQHFRDQVQSLVNTCTIGEVQPIWQQLEIAETYCRCPSGTYGFTCKEYFKNPCQGEQHYFPADASLGPSYFIECSNNIPFLFKCPSTATWNQEIQTCDQTVHECPAGLIWKPEITACDWSGNQCAEGLVFNQQLQSCDWISHQCPEGTAWSTETQSCEWTSHACAEGTTFSLVTKSCEWTTRTCAEGLVWNPDAETCDWAKGSTFGEYSTPEIIAAQQAAQVAPVQTVVPSNLTPSGPQTMTPTVSSYQYQAPSIPMAPASTPIVSSYQYQAPSIPMASAPKPTVSSYQYQAPSIPKAPAPVASSYQYQAPSMPMAPAPTPVAAPAVSSYQNQAQPMRPMAPSVSRPISQPLRSSAPAPIQQSRYSVQY